MWTGTYAKLSHYFHLCKMPPKKQKLSTFYITLNTNRTVDIVSVEQLKTAWKSYYQNIEEFLKFRSGSLQTELPKIKSIKSQAACEVGKSFSRVHIHALIKIEHTSNIQLNVDKSREFFENSLGIDGIHIHVKYVKDELFNIKKYLGKNPL